MPKKKLSDFRTQRQNANAHTPRGLGMLAKSIGQDGWIGGMTVAADGETFDGSARLETLADAMPDAEPIVIDIDGTRPVVLRRTDIPSADDPRAKRLGIAANRVQQVDYAPDPVVLAELAQDVDLSQFWRDDELARINGATPNMDELWKGMPEFEHEDQTAQGAFTIRVFLKDADDLAALGRLLGKDLTGKKFVWFSKQPMGTTYEAYDGPEP